MVAIESEDILISETDRNTKLGLQQSLYKVGYYSEDFIELHSFQKQVQS